LHTQQFAISFRPFSVNDMLVYCCIGPAEERIYTYMGVLFEQKIHFDRFSGEPLDSYVCAHNVGRTTGARANGPRFARVVGFINRKVTPAQFGLFRGWPKSWSALPLLGHRVT